MESVTYVARVLRQMRNRVVDLETRMSVMRSMQVEHRRDMRALEARHEAFEMKIAELEEQCALRHEED